MARILSSVWTIIRGSIGGTTYLSGPQHAIIARNRTAPVQPNSTYTQEFRSSFAEANLRWRLMSDNDRIEWADYASTLFYSGPTGDYTIAGRNVFLAYFTMMRYLNIRGLTAVVPIEKVSEYDGWLGIVVYGSAYTTPSTTGIAFTVINGSATEDIEVHCQISRAFDATRNFFKGPWRTVSAQVQTVPAATSALLDFSGLVEDAYYFVRLRAFTSDAALGARYSSSFVLRLKAVAVGP